MPLRSAAVVTVGVCFDRSFPPRDIVGFGQAAEDGGLDELWVIEDCFYTAGVSLAAAASTPPAVSLSASASFRS